MSLGPLYVLLGEVSVQVLCVFFNWVVFLLEWSHVSSLYILEIRPLSDVSLANMFSHMVGSLFILMLFSLAMQKLFILMRSHLFILSFMSLASFLFSFHSFPFPFLIFSFLFFYFPFSFSFCPFPFSL